MSRIAIAQIDLCVGDIEGNANRIIERATEARDEARAEAVVFPELTLTGYPPEDLLLRPHFHAQIKQAWRRVLDAAQGIDVVIGCPLERDGRLFNACALFRNREVIATYHKRNLPNYGVFDEKRYFSAGEELTLVELGGVKTALSVCEDLWTEQCVSEAARAGAALLVNINASPYHTGKAREREELLLQRATRYGMAIIYVNLVGGQDELVFDGGSLAIDARGRFALKAPQFEQCLCLVTLQQADGGLALRAPMGQAPPLSSEEGIYRALTLGVKDYARKNGFSGAVIGLSGGVDSALTLALAVDALGSDNVEALIMPSRYTADMSVEDARAMAGRLGVSCREISIEAPFSAFSDILAPVFQALPVDATEENIQARCRGILLMALSNKTGKLVLTTGNKSEMAVGYATLYGDMAGGFAPLKDVPKTLVYALSRWRNRCGDGEVIPRRIIERPPTAELRFDQKDSDSLPSYEALDPILEKYIEQDLSPKEIIEAGCDAETVREVIQLVDRNEYKRRQAAPGVKITERAFGRDRRYPITSRYREV